ncbi:tyrosine-type recombinase/integrase [Treponema sp.]|uniref:tyrosine-type recombinase/integrase n=1 Tax=Treponema sp. TaxID=166 RepID=UPI003890EC2F
MRPFYLSKNKYGYYRVHFVDPVTGLKSTGKGTHTKDKFEATMLATRWLETGAPDAPSHSRAFNQQINNKSIPVSIKSFVDNLSESDATTVVELISKKYGITSSTVTETEKPVISKNDASNTAVTKRKKIIVIKKSSTNTVTSNNSEQESNSKAEVLNIGEKHLLCDTLHNFWDYDTSEFIKRSKAHGHSISIKHAMCMQAYIKNYWRPYFGNEMCIEDLTLPALDDFFFHLHDDIELASETVNKNINCANKCFKSLVKMRVLKNNPLEGIERFKADNVKRGIPSEEEIRKLLELDWNNYTAKLAFKVAAFYGLRAGEISGLRVCDIDVVNDMLHVHHSWCEIEKLKSTKNKDTRDIPINHQTALQLMNLAKLNPNYDEKSFIFYAPHNPAEPFYPGYYGDIFYQALDQIGIHEEERKKRNIVFHSLRHFCATYLSQSGDDKTVQAIMGHKTKKMTEHYSDHETQEKYNNMRNIITDAWAKYMTA